MPRMLRQTGKLAPATKPWQLIRDAIADLEIQEKCKVVHVSMGTWHDPAGSKCFQCFAGVVMSRRLSAPLDEHLYPTDFPSAESRLHALNEFRQGLVASAYRELRIRRPPAVPRVVSTSRYCDSTELFKKQMRKLADELEKAHRGKPATKYKRPA
jgi:hypothetical protein